jgi:hypothetical protein
LRFSPDSAVSFVVPFRRATIHEVRAAMWDETEAPTVVAGLAFSPNRRTPPVVVGFIAHEEAGEDTMPLFRSVPVGALALELGGCHRGGIVGFLLQQVTFGARTAPNLTLDLFRGNAESDV